MPGLDWQEYSFLKRHEIMYWRQSKTFSLKYKISGLLVGMWFVLSRKSIWDKKVRKWNYPFVEKLGMCLILINLLLAFCWFPKHKKDIRTGNQSAARSYHRGIRWCTQDKTGSFNIDRGEKKVSLKWLIFFFVARYLLNCHNIWNAK